MKILLIGSKGQIGFHLQKALAPLGTLIQTDRTTLDLLDKKALANLLKDVRADVVVNAAACTNVDQAEIDEAATFAINAEAPQIMAEICKEQNTFFVHYSTDYVFDGTSKRPYKETDAPHPLNVYGASKLEAEKRITAVGGKAFILRTSWVFSTYRRNFLTHLLELARKEPSITLTNDQIGSPTWAQTAAEATATLIAQNSDNYGIYHLAGIGETTRYGLAKEIFKYAPSPEIIGVPTSTFPGKAKRPPYSPLCSDKIQQTFGITLPTWQEMVYFCLS